MVGDEMHPFKKNPEEMIDKVLEDAHHSLIQARSSLTYIDELRHNAEQRIILLENLIERLK
jgi:hypothetical protein